MTNNKPNTPEVIDYNKRLKDPNYLKIMIHKDDFTKLYKYLEEYMNLLMLNIVQEYPKIDTSNKTIEELLKDFDDDDEILEKLTEIKDVENLIDYLTP